MPQRLRHVRHDLARSSKVSATSTTTSPGNYPKPIKIAAPYSNARCLSCHGGAANFIAKHDKDMLPSLMANKDSCLACHGPAHKPDEAGEVAEKQAMR